MKINKFKEDWQNFLSNSKTDKKYKSSMWANLVSDFQVFDFDTLRKNILSGKKYRGYGFKLLKDKNLILKFVLFCSYFLIKIPLFLIQKFWVFRKKLIPPFLTEYPLNIIFLKKQNIYLDYLKSCNNLKIDPSSFNSTKCFYINNRLSSYFNKNIQLKRNILEIGGGLGGLAITLIKNNNINKYLIVDFPEMLLHSSICLNHFFPDKDFFFVNANTTFEKEGIYFVPVYNIHYIPSSFINISLNIDSFQEMSSDQIKNYIDLIQRVSVDGAIFTNINRRKYLDIENFDNNPLLYPYFKSNKILTWETDDFFDQTSNLLKFRKDPWIIREEMINKS